MTALKLLAETNDPATPLHPYDLPKGFEIVGDELREIPPMGFASSFLAGKIFAALWNWCVATNAGVVATAEASYQCFPGKPRQVRKPDVSVILCDPAAFDAPVVHMRTAPAVVVEVVSPNDLYSDLIGKTREFLAAGTRLVWIVEPALREVAVYRADGSVSRVREPDSLSGEDVLPGFTVPLADIFPRRPAAAAE